MKIKTTDPIVRTGLMTVEAYEQYGLHVQPTSATTINWSHAKAQPTVHKGRPSVAELIVAAKEEVRSGAAR